MLGEAPLVRVTLFRLTDEDYHHVCSRHHILLDGWSSPLVNNDLFAFYEAARTGREIALAPVRPFRDYIVWLQQQDLARAEAFWRQNLLGFSSSTPLPLDRSLGRPATANLFDVERLRIPAEVTAALQALVRQERLTLNTLVQAAWPYKLRSTPGRTMSFSAPRFRAGRQP